MSGPIGESDYSRLIEHMFQRLLESGSTEETREAFAQWSNIFGMRPPEIEGPSVFKSLNEMKKESHEKQDEKDLCPVCMDNLCNASELPDNYVPPGKVKMDEEQFRKSIIIMPCSHRFHFFCLLLWLEKAATCPTCRQKVKTDDDYEKEARERRVDELHDYMYG